MEGYSMYFPCYTIGHGVYEKIGKVCRDYGTSAVIIGGHKALAAAREKGLVGIEGKDYIVKDGDVILFRFNV